MKFLPFTPTKELVFREIEELQPQADQHGDNKRKLEAPQPASDDSMDVGCVHQSLRADMRAMLAVHPEQCSLTDEDVDRNLCTMELVKDESHVFGIPGGSHVSLQYVFGELVYGSGVTHVLNTCCA